MIESKVIRIVQIILFVLILSACDRGWNDWNRTEKGAVIGGAGGAALGGIVGSQVGAGGAGAVIGGAAGAGTGALVGREIDRADDDNRRRRY